MRYLARNRCTYTYHYGRYFWSRKSAMKISFVGWCDANTAGIATRHAAHQKDSLCPSSRATDAKYRVQVWMAESRYQRSFLQSCWVVQVISPRITSTATIRTAWLLGKVSLFFRGQSRPPDREVKPILQHFGYAPHSACVAWYDFRRQPAQRTNRE